MPQWLSWGGQAVSSAQSAWRKDEGRGPIRSKHTQSLIWWHNHTHSNLKWLTGRQAGRHTHPHSEEMLLTDTPVKGTPRCQQTLWQQVSFYSPLKKTSSENQLVDLVQGCRGDWLRIAKFLLSIHLGINRTEERELAIFSSLLILKPWDTAIPPVIGKLLFGCQTCKQVWAHTHAAAAAAAGKNNLPENSWMPNILFMFFRVFRVVENKKLCI